MSGIGELVLAWAEWLRKLVPFRLVRDWEQGVRLRAGNVTALLTSRNGLRGTGLHLFWPLIGEVLVAPILQRGSETTLQTIATSDGQNATVSLCIRWSVRDLAKVSEKVHDTEETLLDLVRGTIGIVTPTLAWADLGAQLVPRVVEELRRRTEGWGLKIHEVYLVNLTAAQTIRIITETSNPSVANMLGLGE